MKENIICSGALFYCTSTKRFLFVQRTDSKTRGLWGLVGGQSRFTESAFEGLKREIQEEIGETSRFKKIIPLEMFTSNDQKFYRGRVGSVAFLVPQSTSQLATILAQSNSWHDEYESSRLAVNFSEKMHSFLNSNIPSKCKFLFLQEYFQALI